MKEGGRVHVKCRVGIRAKRTRWRFGRPAKVSVAEGTGGLAGWRKRASAGMDRGPAYRFRIQAGRWPLAHKVWHTRRHRRRTRGIASIRLPKEWRAPATARSDVCGIHHPHWRRFGLPRQGNRCTHL